MNLTDREWKEFYIGRLFEVKRPSARSEKEYDSGKYPFVASGNFNNGVIRCCSQKEGERVDNGNCITVSPVDGSAFYQISDFLGRGGAGSSVLLLYNEKINRYSGLYISKALRQTCSKYSYGKMGNQDGIKRERIMLPIDNLDNPDYSFMEEYVREEEKHKKEKYIAYAKKQLEKLKYIEVPALDEIEWKPFAINDLFEKIDSGKGKGLNHLYKTNKNGVNYIGATHRNNGVLCQIEIDDKSRKMIQQGNCIGFIRNGNGSVGYAVYKAETFISTSDVSFAYSQTMNKYIGLFILTSSNLIRGKYNHNYKRTPERLRKDGIMLPVNDTGLPAYEYMEQYAKNLTIVKLKKYLAFTKKKNN